MESDLMRGLRCSIGLHGWVKSVVEGEARLTCSRCGKVIDSVEPRIAGQSML